MRGNGVAVQWLPRLEDAEDQHGKLRPGGIPSLGLINIGII